MVCRYGMDLHLQQLVRTVDLLRVEEKLHFYGWDFILPFLPALVTWQYGLLVSELANVAGDFEKFVFREKSLLVKG